MYKAWSRIKEVPYRFPRSIVKFQGRVGIKITHFDQNLAFPDCNLSLKETDGCEMMHKAWRCIEEVPYCIPRPFVIFQGHTGSKIADFDPNWVFLQFELTDGYGMMYKAWSGVGEVPYCFPRSTIKFQGNNWQKWPVLPKLSVSIL